MGGAAGGAQRLKVPLEEQDSWSERFSALDLELSRGRDGYREAALAHLTLLLVEVSRLAADIVGIMIYCILMILYLNSQDVRVVFHSRRGSAKQAAEATHES